jgi:hypothetical protein
MKKAFTFDWHLDLNHVLTAIAVLIAAGGLYYQAQSTSIARRELTAKLTDIAQLAAQIESEISARQNLELQAVQDRNADLKDANRLAQAILDASQSEARNIAKSEEIFARSLFALAALIKSENPASNSIRSQVVDAIMAMQAKIVSQSDAVFKNMRAREAAVRRCDTALAELANSSVSAQDRERRSNDALSRLGADIAAANKELEQTLSDSKEQQQRLETMMKDLPLEQLRP